MSETEIYIEQGCDINAFERDVNTALSKLCLTREVVGVQYKTGTDHKENGIDVNWYSVAVEHRRKESYEFEKMMKSFEELIKKIASLNFKISKTASMVDGHSKSLDHLLIIDEDRKRKMRVERSRKLREKEKASESIEVLIKNKPKAIVKKREKKKKLEK